MEKRAFRTNAIEFCPTILHYSCRLNFQFTKENNSQRANNFNNATLFMQAYHQAHLEAIKGFGMHGYEIEFENLVEEYQVKTKITSHSD